VCLICGADAYRVATGIRAVYGAEQASTEATAPCTGYFLRSEPCCKAVSECVRVCVCDCVCDCVYTYRYRRECNIGNAIVLPPTATIAEKAKARLRLSRGVKLRAGDMKTIDRCIKACTRGKLQVSGRRCGWVLFVKVFAVPTETLSDQWVSGCLLRWAEETTGC